MSNWKAPLTPAQLQELRTRLAQAQATGDPDRILIQTDAAIALFDIHGWPDDWVTWTSSRDEAETTHWLEAH